MSRVLPGNGVASAFIAAVLVGCAAGPAETLAYHWQTAFGVSVPVEPGMIATGGREAEVALEADRVDVLRADRTTRPGHRMSFWVEEAGSGRVVAGTARP
jgi:hypothetical protein